MPPASLAGKDSSDISSARARVAHRRRQAAGLGIIAVLILIFSLWRAGLATVFPVGWWRIW